jgi:hypothetical protein
VLIPVTHVEARSLGVTWGWRGRTSDVSKIESSQILEHAQLLEQGERELAAILRSRSVGLSSDMLTGVSTTGDSLVVQFSSNSTGPESESATTKLTFERFDGALLLRSLERQTADGYARSTLDDYRSMGAQVIPFRQTVYEGPIGESNLRESERMESRVYTYQITRLESGVTQQDIALLERPGMRTAVGGPVERE